MDPRNLSFPGRRPDEEVILLLRRHWTVLLLHGIISLILLLIPLIAGFVVFVFFPKLQENTFFPLIVLAFWLYLMFVWTYFFIGWVDYYLDTWIVTNDRIINIEQNGLFNRIVSEHKLYRIQDVTAEVNGAFKTFFNFGTVYVQTAAEVQRFSFEQIPEPYQVKKIVLDLHDKALQKEIERQAEIEAHFTDQNSKRLTEDKIHQPHLSETQHHDYQQPNQNKKGN